MAKAIKKIGSVKVVLVSKTEQNTIINGHFGGICPKSFHEHKPNIKVYVEQVVIHHCGSDKYILKEVQLMDADGGVTVSEFFSDSKDQQYEAYSRLIKIFVDFKKRYMTSMDGDISVEDYCDWGKKKKDNVKKDEDKKTSSSSSKSSTQSSTTHSGRNSSTTRYEKKAMFIRRKGKKLSEKSLNTMREKVAAIADGTYEFKIPCVLKTEVIEIDVIEDKNKLVNDAQQKLEDTFNQDAGSL